HGERQVESIRSLADGNDVVAHLAEQPPSPLGHRLATEGRECLGRAEPLRRASDEEDACRRYPIRHGPEETLTRPCRTQPQSVTPRSVASSIASDDGAPTAARIGHPATAAFCTSSNESRPLTHSTLAASGRRPSPNAQPTTLSMALWRPTS